MFCPPQSTCYFFKSTSAWIAVLACMAWQENHMLLSVLLFANAAVSAWHWHCFRHASVLARIDQLLASTILLLVTMQSPCTARTIFTICTIILFIAGRHAYQRREWNSHAYLHASFRFAAFWLVFVTIWPVNCHSLLLCSSLYWTHFTLNRYSAHSAQAALRA